MQKTQAIKRLVIACALVGATSGAKAAILTNATSVQITNIFPVSGQQYLQVGEFAARQSGSYTDVAAESHGGTAFLADQWDANHGASEAIDSNFNTDFFNPAGIFHSQSNAAGLLTINFAVPTNLQGIAIYGRTDGGFNVRDLYQVTIFSGRTKIYTGVLDATAGHGSVVSFVPEPETWAMMIVGLGGLCSMLRFKRRRPTALTVA